MIAQAWLTELAQRWSNWKKIRTDKKRRQQQQADFLRKYESRAVPLWWTFSEDGSLLMNGDDWQPLSMYTLEHFEQVIERMTARAQAEQPHVIIQAIAIEPHVAKALYLTGGLTKEDFDRAKAVGSSYFEIRTPRFSKGDIPFRLVSGTYSIDYDVVISQHSDGIVLSRDVPDLLAILSGEKEF